MRALRTTGRLHVSTRALCTSSLGYLTLIPPACLSLAMRRCMFSPRWCTVPAGTVGLLSLFFCFSLSTAMTFLSCREISQFSSQPPHPWHTIQHGTRTYTYDTYIHRERGKIHVFLLPCSCHKQNLSWFGLASNESLSQETIPRPERETTRERASH
ncbi:hypothetical protein HOY80DRAFT_977043 [Tuber brumale]|nr:hypothetical protein HOY80DRAFT_977043 [Tuber brumale]